MHLPAQFTITDTDTLYQLIDDEPLGTLISHDGDLLQLDLLPFYRDGDTLITHIARANPLAGYVDGQQVLIAFYGAGGYVSPNHYASKAIHHRHVPTYNYQVVQVRGVCEVFDDSKSLMALLGKLTKKHEATQATPWAMKDAPADYIKDELTGIVGIRLHIDDIVGKFKLSQNRSLSDIGGVIDGLHGEGQVAHAAAVKRFYRGGE